MSSTEIMRNVSFLETDGQQSYAFSILPLKGVLFGCSGLLGLRVARFGLTDRGASPDIRFGDFEVGVVVFERCDITALKSALPANANIFSVYFAMDVGTDGATYFRVRDTSDPISSNVAYHSVRAGIALGPRLFELLADGGRIVSDFAGPESVEPSYWLDEPICVRDTRE